MSPPSTFGKMIANHTKIKSVPTIKHKQGIYTRQKLSRKPLTRSTQNNVRNHELKTKREIPYDDDVERKKQKVSGNLFALTKLQNNISIYTFLSLIQSLCLQYDLSAHAVNAKY